MEDRLNTFIHDFTNMFNDMNDNMIPADNVIDFSFIDMESVNIDDVVELIVKMSESIAGEWKIRGNKWNDIICEANTNRIKNVFFNSTNGLPIVNYTVNPDDDPIYQHDKDIVGALLTAMKSFANSLEGEEIEMIETTSYRWVTLPSMVNEVIFIAVTDCTVDKFECVRMLSDARNVIIERYRDEFIGTRISIISDRVRDDVERILVDAVRSFKIKRIKKMFCV